MIREIIGFESHRKFLQKRQIERPRNLLDITGWMRCSIGAAKDYLLGFGQQIKDPVVAIGYDFQAVDL